MVGAMQAILSAMEDNGISFKHPENKVGDAQNLKRCSPFPFPPFSPLLVAQRQMLLDIGADPL